MSVLSFFSCVHKVNSINAPKNTDSCDNTQNKKPRVETHFDHRAKNAWRKQKVGETKNVIEKLDIMVKVVLLVSQQGETKALPERAVQNVL